MKDWNREKMPELVYDEKTKCFKQKVERVYSEAYLHGDPGLGGDTIEEFKDARIQEEKLGPRWVGTPERTAPKGTYVPAALARARKRVVQFPTD